LYPNARIAVYARSRSERTFALALGADWAGDTQEPAPFRCHAIIDTTPAWKPVRAAMEQLRPGGRLIINAIRKEESDKKDLLKLEYEQHLWQEKSIRSVANVTRSDVENCLELAAEMSLEPEISTYSLEEANQALLEIKRGGLKGAKVLVPV
jgi:propanol-preferring alcohol dehydrogenase